MRYKICSIYFLCKCWPCSCGVNILGSCVYVCVCVCVCIYIYTLTRTHTHNFREYLRHNYMAIFTFVCCSVKPHYLSNYKKIYYPKRPINNGDIGINPRTDGTDSSQKILLSAGNRRDYIMLVHTFSFSM